MYVRSRSSQVMMTFPAESVEGGSRFHTRKSLEEGVCFFAVAVVVHLFVYIVASYTEGHGKECVTEMVRVESADSPLSAMAGVKLLPKAQVNVRSHSSISSQMIKIQSLSCRVS